MSINFNVLYCKCNKIIKILCDSMCMMSLGVVCLPLNFFKMFCYDERRLVNV